MQLVRYRYTQGLLARVENREGQIIFKGAQPQKGAFKRGAECPKGGLYAKRGAQKCLKGAPDA